MNENILNVWLQIKSFIRFVFSVKPNITKPKDVLKYRLVFSDFFLGDKLNYDKLNNDKLNHNNTFFYNHISSLC